MATKRMFKSEITDEETFLNMSDGAQVLYFHLLGKADDDGFIRNTKGHLRFYQKTGKQLKELVTNGYVIEFSSTVYVVTHWNAHNTIQADRHRPTLYTNEMSRLRLDESKIYHLVDGTEKNENITAAESTNSEPEQKDEVETFFDNVWKLYPRKLGKGSVTREQKEKLFKIGYEHIVRCIIRYKLIIEQNHTEQKYIKYGSTFFNGSYVDFLDENYEPPADSSPDLQNKSEDEVDRISIEQERQKYGKS